MHQGISLSPEQYAALLKAAPGINAALRQHGHDIDSVDDDVPEPEVEKKSNKKKKERSSKSNIEATSDEDSS